MSGKVLDYLAGTLRLHTPETLPGWACSHAAASQDSQPRYILCEMLSSKYGRSEEGDQQRFWKLTRRFIEDLAQAYPGEAPRVRAVS